MFKATKVLMLLWLFLCGGIGACSVIAGGAGAVATADEITLEEVMAQNPDLSEEEAQEMVDLGQAGAAIGGSLIAGIGVIGAVGLWFVGMIPLLIMYLVFKPSGTTVQVQQVVGNASAVQTSEDKD